MNYVITNDENVMYIFWHGGIVSITFLYTFFLFIIIRSSFNYLLLLLHIGSLLLSIFLCDFFS